MSDPRDELLEYARRCGTAETELRLARNSLAALHSQATSWHARLYDAEYLLRVAVPLLEAGGYPEFAARIAAHLSAPGGTSGE